MRELNITTREEGQRLDKILSKYLNKAPKSFVYKMLRKKNIKLNGKKATGNEKLSKGDQVCIYLAEDTINKSLYIPFIFCHDYALPNKSFLIISNRFGSGA